MLFLTNRGLNEGGSIAGAQLPRDITFAEHNQAQQEVFYCELNESNFRTVEIGCEELFRRMHQSSYKEIFFFIHGMSVSPPTAFRMAQDFQNLFDSREPNRCLVVPWIWASGSQLTNYWNDKITAEASGIGFARGVLMLKDLIDESFKDITQAFVKPMHLFAHSMGNRVLRATIRDISIVFLRDMPYLFKHIFMGAADLPNEAVHNGEPLYGGLIPFCSDFVSIYYANDDIALKASAVANSFTSKMLGLTGIEEIGKTLGNVIEFDCSSFNQAYSPDSIGHNYFWMNSEGRESPVFEHMYEAIATKKVPVGNDTDRSVTLPIQI